MKTITWTIPTNSFGNEDLNSRVGTVEGSTEEFVMNRRGEGWVIYQRPDEASVWTDMVLDFTDIAAAVEHRRYLDLCEGSHPDSINSRLNRNPEALDSLASAIHEGDWNMAGPRWTWGDATTHEKALARDLARKAFFAYAANDAEDQHRMVEYVITAALPMSFSANRIEAKTAKAMHWFSINPEFCDPRTDPTIAPVRNVSDYSPAEFTKVAGA